MSKARSATWTCSLFSWTGSAPSGPNCRSSASFVIMLIFHPFDHWRESWAIRSNQEPCGLPEPLGEPRRFSLEHWRFPKTLNVDQTVLFTRSWRCIRNRCLNCLSYCSRNVRQSCQPVWLVDFQRSTSRSLDPNMLLSLQRVNLLRNIFSLCIEGQVNSNCFDSVSCGRARTLADQYKCLILCWQPSSTNQPRFTNQRAPPPWCVFVKQKLDLEPK